ncbi:MAG: peptidase [Enterovirga sp.]|nr:peptidase [Enterovirga sp.]
MTHPIVAELDAFKDELIAIRRDIHAHPETGFEENRTAALVAEKLRGWGVEVTENVGRTGVVGTIRGARPGNRAIGLRADMDALHIVEQTGLPYASTNPGKMHACGHDGHTTMLLGAARYLTETRNFDGTVYVIFQPAEENFGGGDVMVKEGLFDRFPMERVFGLHNWPGAPEGTFYWRVGPIMAAVANLEVTITGRGAHGAMPHQGVDPIVIAAAIVQALQSIVARNVEPVDAGVITIGHINGGFTYNVIPETVRMLGTARWFAPDVGDILERRFIETVTGIAAAMGATATAEFRRAYPATVNEEVSTHLAADAARAVQGEARVIPMPKPTMGGEDFSFMLNAKDGAYLMLGAGRGANDPQVHHPRYDFNDAILPVGASWWAMLAERLLAKA